MTVAVSPPTTAPGRAVPLIDVRATAVRPAADDTNLCVLARLHEAGLTLDSSCQEGICDVCETKVISGSPDHRDSVLSDHEHTANCSMMICYSGCKTDRLVLDL